VAVCVCRGQRRLGDSSMMSGVDEPVDYDQLDHDRNELDSDGIDDFNIGGDIHS